MAQIYRLDDYRAPKIEPPAPQPLTALDYMQVAGMAMMGAAAFVVSVTLAYMVMGFGYIGGNDAS